MGAAASGRNSGVLQHPMEPALVGLHEETLRHYAELGHGFALPPEPAGVLVLDADIARTQALRDQLARAFPELAPEALDGAALEAAEPGLAGDLSACRLDTGRPVPPAAATRAFAARATAAGASLATGVAATPWLAGGRAAGVELASGERVAAGAVVRRRRAVDPGAGRPGRRVAADRAAVGRRGGGAPARAAARRRRGVRDRGARPRAAPRPARRPSASSPRPGARCSARPSSPRARTRPCSSARWSSAARASCRRCATPRVGEARACARPLSRDGRPLLGPVTGRDGLFVAAGHGPWGISLGPGSARLVADVVLDRDGARIPDVLAAARFGPPPG